MRHLTNRTRRSLHAGFSLVELAIVVVLLAIVLGSVAMIGNASDRAYRTGSVSSHLESQVASTIEKVVDELQIAGVDTITPDPIQGVGASSIRYVQATGIVGNDVVWTPLRRLAFEYEVGEIDDGIDNNHNGLVDEGRIVLTEDVGGPNERRRVLTHWVGELLEGEQENGLDDNGNGLVDERGFFVERVGEAIVIRLTLQRRTADGFLLSRTAQTSTTPRNRLGD